MRDGSSCKARSRSFAFIAGAGGRGTSCLSLLCLFPCERLLYCPPPPCSGLKSGGSLRAEVSDALMHDHVEPAPEGMDYEALMEEQVGAVPDFLLMFVFSLSLLAVQLLPRRKVAPGEAGNQRSCVHRCYASCH